MKLNLGCGQNKIDGFVNIDKFPECDPDKVMDLEEFPWSFQTSSVKEVLLNHVLEHLGRDTEVFLSIIKEIYRICEHGALVKINVPHPRHDFFMNDPTHVRIITPQIMQLFSKKNCIQWKQNRISNSPLALYTNVDFEIIESVAILDDQYKKLFKDKLLSSEEINQYMKDKNNVVSEYRMTLKAIKQEEL